MVDFEMSKPRVLIVDDEEGIRDVAKLQLESFGFAVLAVEAGRRALKVFEEGPFDLVITDMLMPEMDGVELINELRRRRPDQKVLAISGGGRASKESYLKIAQLCGAQEILAKPFNRDQLIEAVIACGLPPPAKPIE